MSDNFNLSSSYKPSGSQPAAIEKLTVGLNDGLAKQILLGVTGSGKTYTIANIIKNVQRPTIILAHNKTLSAQLYGEMKEFFPDNAVEYFVSYYDYYQPEAYVPGKDLYIEKDAAINEHVEQMRLSATKALLERKDCIIVATVSAIYGLGDPNTYLSMVLHIKQGDKIQRRDLLEKLTAMQYIRNDIDFQRGNYRVRGDVIDVFPAESELDAIRFEMFDDEIERIVKFDPLTGKLTKQLSRTTVYPKTHYVTPHSRILQVIDNIKDEMKQQVLYFESQKKLIEAQRIAERTRYDLEMMVELGYCTGIENYSRYLSGRDDGNAPPTLIDYLPENALMIIDESHVTVPQLGAMYKGDLARKQNLVNFGFRLPSALDNRPLKFEEFEQLMPQTIFVSATPGKYELERNDSIVEQVIRPTGLLDPIVEVRPATNQVDDVYQQIQAVVKRKSRVLITTLTKKMAEDLTGYLLQMHVKVKYLHSDIDTVERVELVRGLRQGKFDVLVGINLLREGLDMPEVELVAILDADKEGFLRSERSLIQTIGRAARNLNGKAILYADKITPSMRLAIDETQRRRKLQSEYNTKNNITPKTIVKAITNIMEVQPEVSESEATTELPKFNDLKQLTLELAKLEKSMFQLSDNLQFEEAARIRDLILQLKEQAKYLQ